MATLRKRGNIYYIIVSLGRDPKTGKYKQKWISTGTSSVREARKIKADIESKLNKNQMIDATNMFLKDYLKMFLEDYAKHNVAETTFDSYKNAVNNITEEMGYIPLEKLLPVHIQKFLSKLMTTGDKSHTTIRYYYSVLNIALNVAVKWRLIENNPCKGVTPPQKAKQEIRVYNEEQVKKLIEGTKESPIHLPIVLAVACGLRRGEILGLKWQDIDFENKTIHINRQLTKVGGKTIERQTKTNSGKRTVSISDFVYQKLKKERINQRKNKLRYGPDYISNDYVCKWSDGNIFRPDYITHKFQKIVKGLNLPKISFHDLRHTHATLLLKKGVHPKIVQERLGHSSISMTLDTYSHVTPDIQKEAADKMDKLLSDY